MPRRQQQVGKARKTAHLPQVFIPVGGGSAHVVCKQVAGHRHIGGLALVIAGVEHLKVDRFKVVFGSSLAQHVVGAIRQLLRRPCVEAVGAERRVHGGRVYAAVAVR